MNSFIKVCETLSLTQSFKGTPVIECDTKQGEGPSSLSALECLIGSRPCLVLGVVLLLLVALSKCPARDGAANTALGRENSRKLL